MIDPENWLTSYAPGYGALKPPERDAIAYFCLLWSLFEAQQMANNANAKRICDRVREIARRCSCSKSRLNISEIDISHMANSLTILMHLIFDCRIEGDS